MDLGVVPDNQISFGSPAREHARSGLKCRDRVGPCIVLPYHDERLRLVAAQEIVRVQPAIDDLLDGRAHARWPARRHSPRRKAECPRGAARPSRRIGRRDAVEAQLHAVGALDRESAVLAARDFAREEVRRADEARDEARHRPLVDFRRRAELLDLASRDMTAMRSESVSASS